MDCILGFGGADGFTGRLVDCGAGGVIGRITGIDGAAGAGDAKFTWRTAISTMTGGINGGALSAASHNGKNHSTAPCSTNAAATTATQVTAECFGAVLIQGAHCLRLDPVYDLCMVPVPSQR